MIVVKHLKYQVATLSYGNNKIRNKNRDDIDINNFNWFDNQNYNRLIILETKN
jgi:hypothetical protein